MIKAIFLLKRIPEITHEQFREHYENFHVKLAKKYFGDRMIRYERNYLGRPNAPPQLGAIPAGYDYDCMTEWVMPDEETLEEIARIFDDPVIGAEFHADGVKFLGGSVAFVCRDVDMVNTGTGGGALAAWTPKYD